jgi:hypothetical protein
VQNVWEPRFAQKQYYFFNELLSKEEYEKRIEALVLTPNVIAQLRAQSETVRLSTPHRSAHITQCENVTGDHWCSVNSREVYDSKPRGMRLLLRNLKWGQILL